MLCWSGSAAAAAAAATPHGPSTVRAIFEAAFREVQAVEYALLLARVAQAKQPRVDHLAHVFKLVA